MGVSFKDSSVSDEVFCHQCNDEYLYADSSV